MNAAKTNSTSTLATVAYISTAFVSVAGSVLTVYLSSGISPLLGS